MNRHLLFCALLGSLAACTHEAEIQPGSASLAGEVAGTYRTNAYLDLSCVALPAGQMPYAELKPETDSSVTFVYTRLYPNKSTQQIANVSLRRQADVIQLRLANRSIGTLQTDRLFTNNGMEKQGKVLRVTMQSDPQNVLYFSGAKE